MQVAYWATLLAVAQKHSGTSYPAFLLIDSPRQAVNDSDFSGPRRVSLS